MPRRQLEKAVSGELGPDWRSKVADFDEEPLAAASIGQVRIGRELDFMNQLLGEQLAY